MPRPRLSITPISSPPSSPAPSLTPPADDEPTQIFPRLFISSLSTAESPSIICAHRITHILTIHRLAPPILSTSHPIERMHLPLTDTPFTDLLCHLPSTTQWIHDSLTSSPDSRVLVHCEMGISRSTSVVVGYIMWARGCAVDEAVGMVKEKRAVARPNEGFLTQLGEWREVCDRERINGAGDSQTKANLTSDNEARIALPHTTGPGRTRGSAGAM